MGGTSQILRTSWASASSACPGARDTSLAELEPPDGRKRLLLDLPDAHRRIGDDCPVAADDHRGQPKTGDLGDRLDPGAATQQHLTADLARPWLPDGGEAPAGHQASGLAVTE